MTWEKHKENTESEYHRYTKNEAATPPTIYMHLNILPPFWNIKKKSPLCFYSKTSAADKLDLLKYFGKEEVDERRSRCSGWPLMLWSLKMCKRTTRCSSQALFHVFPALFCKWLCSWMCEPLVKQRWESTRRRTRPGRQKQNLGTETPLSPINNTVPRRTA